MGQNFTRVYLLNTPLENNYHNTLYFQNKNDQESYFGTCIRHYFDDFTYQRKEEKIRVPKGYDEIQDCNYVMYRNQKNAEPSSDDKWYFCFIKEMKYVNDERTDIIIQTDVLQTWMFDFEVKASFIEREHVDNDDIGRHTLDEGLDIGEYIVNDYRTPIERNRDDLCYVMATTRDPNNGNDLAGGNVYHGIATGVTYYRYDNATDLTVAIRELDNKGVGDAIVSIFMCPKDLVEGYNASTHKINQSTSPKVTDIDIAGMYEWAGDGYTPRNNKLFCYPYRFLRVSNNAGASAVYRYEYFTSQLSFRLYEVLTPSISGRLIPKNYKNTTLYHDEGLTEGKYPICNWNNDAYTNWLTQNAVNEKVSFEQRQNLKYFSSATQGIMSAVGLIGSMATLNVAGGVASGIGLASSIGNIMDLMQAEYQPTLIPDTVSGNINAGDVNTSMNANTFHFYGMTIRQESAKIIDEFFDMFGYKCKRVKVPNKNHRQNYWYTKTCNVNILGDKIPQNDMEIIKHCYDNGITFWKDPDNIMNYTVTNSITTD